MDAKMTTVMRLVLMGREVYRLKRGQRGLRIRSGRAWVTLNGRDYILGRGEEIALQARGDDAVVSALGRAPVMIELLGEAPRRPRLESHPAVSAL